MRGVHRRSAHKREPRRVNAKFCGMSFNPRDGTLHVARRRPPIRLRRGAIVNIENRKPFAREPAIPLGEIAALACAPRTAVYDDYARAVSRSVMRNVCVEL
jgi:hypothetical protein